MQWIFSVATPRLIPASIAVAHTQIRRVEEFNVWVIRFNSIRAFDALMAIVHQKTPNRIHADGEPPRTTYIIRVYRTYDSGPTFLPRIGYLLFL